MDNLVALAAMDAQYAAEKAEPNLEAQLRAAMEATRSHWMVTNEDTQFMAACEGTARVCSPEDKERIEASLRLLSSLSAASSGVPVDFGALLPDDEDEEPVKPARLMPLWREIKHGEAAKDAAQ